MTRVITVLLVLTVALQMSILYRQNSASRLLPPASPVQDAPSGITIDITALPTKGNPDANIVMIEFSDYECPFCARHANTVAREIEEKLISKGTLRHVFANNPLPSHIHARLLAEAAICADKQGHFWELHNELFRSMPKSTNDVVAAAETVGADALQFQNCLANSRELLENIERDQKHASRLGLGGTPGFAIGTRGPNGAVTIKKLIRGAQPLSVFEKAISEASG